MQPFFLIMEHMSNQYSTSVLDEPKYQFIPLNRFWNNWSCCDPFRHRFWCLIAIPFFNNVLIGSTLKSGSKSGTAFRLTVFDNFGTHMGPQASPFSLLVTNKLSATPSAPPPLHWDLCPRIQGDFFAWKDLCQFSLTLDPIPPP